MIDDLTVKIFADGADLDAILALAADRRIAGFTTNPTLMWKAGLTDYEEFARRLLERITEHPISFEVFADDADEMRRQARMIATWGDNVYVKIPVSTTSGESMAPLVRELSEAERGFEKLTARLNGILETMIRRHPEQWLWLHNRWRLDEGLDSPSE